MNNTYIHAEIACSLIDYIKETKGVTICFLAKRLGINLNTLYNIHSSRRGGKAICENICRRIYRCYPDEFTESMCEWIENGGIQE